MLKLNYQIHQILNSKYRFLFNLVVTLIIYSVLYENKIIFCMNDDIPTNEQPTFSNENTQSADDRRSRLQTSTGIGWPNSPIYLLTPDININPEETKTEMKTMTTTSSTFSPEFSTEPSFIQVNNSVRGVVSNFYFSPDGVNSYFSPDFVPSNSNTASIPMYQPASPAYIPDSTGLRPSSPYYGPSSPAYRPTVPFSTETVEALTLPIQEEQSTNLFRQPRAWTDWLFYDQEEAREILHPHDHFDLGTRVYNLDCEINKFVGKAYKKN